MMSMGWSEENEGCSVYLVDKKFYKISDTIAVKLCGVGLDPSVYFQALRDTFVSVGRDVACFLNPLVSAARKTRTRQEEMNQSPKR